MRLRTLGVVLPVRDGAEHLAAAVDSVLAQALPAGTRLDLLVIDDGSRDATPEVLHRYRSHAEVRVVPGPGRGLVAALNLGLDTVRGDLVARMDADDIMVAGRLTAQLALLDRRQDVVACGTDYVLTGAGSGHVRVPRSGAACRAHLLLGSPMAHPTVMLRRRTLERHDLRYRPEALHAEDYLFFSELAAHGELVNLPRVGLRYRLHATQVSTAHADVQAATTLQIALANLRAAGCTDVDPLALDRALRPTGVGPLGAATYLRESAPLLLDLGRRGAGAAGVVEASRVVRERVRRVLAARGLFAGPGEPGGVARAA